MNVTVRNIITSMRLMSAFDWHDFFESVSMVDEFCGNGSNFGEMDFATRDYYRHAVEDLSRGSSHSEIDIARRAIDRAKRARAEFHTDGQPSADRKADPGYYLISHGRLDFERELGFRVPWRRGFLRLYVRAAVPGYLGTIASSLRLFSRFLLRTRTSLGVRTLYLVLLGLLAFVPASDLAIALINRAVTDLFGPRTLPRLELRDGVPTGAAHHNRRPHSFHFGSSDQGTRRAAGNPLPGQSGRGSAIRAALRLGGRPHRVPAGR